MTALASAIRAALRKDGVGPAELDDVIQETLTRLLEVRGRLEPATMAGYAVAVARNVVRAESRRREVAARGRHRLLDLTSPVEPDVAMLRAEERAAVQAAVAALPATVRSDLLSQPLGDPLAPTEVLRRARLARARARTRVEYVCALRHVDPSPQCRAVLLSISARDGRRQRQLNAGGHLLECPVCASLAEPLLQRRRGLAAVVPLPLLAWSLRRPPGRSNLGTAAGAVVGAAAIVAGVVTAGVVTSRSSSSPVESAQAMTLGSARPSAATFESSSVAGSTLGTVFFATASAVIDPEGYRAVEATATLIASRHVRAVTITGYSDSTASQTVNVALSQRRATAVAALLHLLVGPGVAIVVLSRGEADPTTSNATAAGQAQNRRVVVAVTP